MLARVRVSAAGSGRRSVVISWRNETRERELVIRGDGLVRWPSADDDETDLEPVLRNVSARTPAKGDSIQLGSALFRAVIGDVVWAQITEAAHDSDHVELRLQFEVTDAVINAQHWELMHDGERFLAIGRPAVAIVREIDVPGEGRSEVWEPVIGPPRLLFAIGSDLHDADIRPGAEFLALLREIGRSSNNLPRVRFLESASVEKLGRAIKEFNPHAVHLVAHGDAPASGPFLELRADDGHGASRVTAPQLLPALCAGSSPPMVLLSACRTAQSTRLPEGLGVAIAPFASQLVRGGVPTVVGMSGEVTDRTCRLFARRFGAGLVDGERLVIATTDARQAAFQNGMPPDTSIDWSLPSLFVTSDMPADFAPVEPPRGKTARDRLIEFYDIAIGSDHNPVFAGRLSHVEGFTRILGPKEPSSMLLHGAPGVGVNRLRDELLILAVCDGCPVVRVPLRDCDYPQNYAAAVLAIYLNTFTTRNAHGAELDEHAHRSASRVGRTIVRLQNLARDDPLDFDEIAANGVNFTIWQREVQSEPMSTFDGFEKTLTDDLLADLASMLDDIRAATGAAPDGPLLIDLPDIDKWGGATSLVLEYLLKARLVLPGDGDDDGRRVRLLATYRDAAIETDEPARQLREQAGARVEVVGVSPFSEEEERLAIPWVLLHPYGEWDKVIVPSRDDDIDWYAEYRDSLRFLADSGVPIESAPECFTRRTFVSTINRLCRTRHLVSDEYSDAALLIGLGGR